MELKLREEEKICIDKKTWEKIEREYHEVRNKEIELRKLAEKRELTEDESADLAWTDAKSWGMARIMNIIEGKE